MKHEEYRVSTGNGTSQWGAGNLKKSQRIALQGYLAQRITLVGSIPLVAVEVAVDEFFVMDDLPRAEAKLEDIQEGGERAEEQECKGVVRLQPSSR